MRTRISQLGRTFFDMRLGEATRGPFRIGNNHSWPPLSSVVVENMDNTSRVLVPGRGIDSKRFNHGWHGAGVRAGRRATPLRSHGGPPGHSGRRATAAPRPISPPRRYDRELDPRLPGPGRPCGWPSFCVPQRAFDLGRLPLSPSKFLARSGWSCLLCAWRGCRSKQCRSLPRSWW